MEYKILHAFFDKVYGNGKQILSFYDIEKFEWCFYQIRKGTKFVSKEEIDEYISQMEPEEFLEELKKYDCSPSDYRYILRKQGVISTAPAYVVEYKKYIPECDEYVMEQEKFYLEKIEDFELPENVLETAVEIFNPQIENKRLMTNDMKDTMFFTKTKYQEEKIKFVLVNYCSQEAPHEIIFNADVEENSGCVNG